MLRILDEKKIKELILGADSYAFNKTNALYNLITYILAVYNLSQQGSLKYTTIWFGYVYALQIQYSRIVNSITGLFSRLNLTAVNRKETVERQRSEVSEIKWNYENGQENIYIKLLGNSIQESIEKQLMGKEDIRSKEKNATAHITALKKAKEDAIKNIEIQKAKKKEFSDFINFSTHYIKSNNKCESYESSWDLGSVDDSLCRPHSIERMEPIKLLSSFFTDQRIVDGCQISFELEYLKLSIILSTLQAKKYSMLIEKHKKGISSSSNSAKPIWIISQEALEPNKFKSIDEQIFQATDELDLISKIIQENQLNFKKMSQYDCYNKLGQFDNLREQMKSKRKNGMVDLMHLIRDNNVH